MTKFLKKISLLDWIFIAELFLFSLIIIGILPREASLYLAGLLIIYTIFASLDNSTILFVRSIPLFLALPITESFDNFNTWRILSGIIFLKFLISNFKLPINLRILKSKTSISLLLILLFSILSIIPAGDKMLAIKRIIYFLNLSLIGFVIYDLAKNEIFAKRLIKNIAVPTIIVVVAGFLQVISTYVMDIYQFMRIWGEGIQCKQFGNQWCDIAVQLGNTWFAYYGEQLSLRVFSLFPDSHSFPQFILLGLPAIFALSLNKLIDKHRASFKAMFNARGTLISVFIPLVFLAAILSGTRGIWAASIGVLLFAGLIIYKLRRERSHEHKRIMLYITSYMILFFAIFAIAFPIFSSPQFLLQKDSSELIGRRIRSIIDFGETSNSQRIEIWKKSFSSIVDKPLLGVGIGNFPVVLGQNLFLARAGSSAHNIYLHIAAEMGIPALIAVIWFLILLLNKTYLNFVRSQDAVVTVYNGASLLTIPWVLLYSLTDVALFDERAFLFFVITVSLILSRRQ